jgi:hypothetical protein
MSTEKHHGYTNRETWALALHLTNDADVYKMARGWLTECDPGTEREYVRGQVTALLNPAEYRETWGTIPPDWVTLMAWDVGSVWRVNWDEIVQDLTN